MKPIYLVWLIALFVLPCTRGLKAQGSLFREGYVITEYGDTIRGFISNKSKDEIRFRDDNGHKVTFTSGDLKGYVRCNLKFISSMIPGDTANIFITCLGEGTIDLFATIVPEGNSGMVVPVLVGGAIGGLVGALAGGAIGAAAGSGKSECEKEYYSFGTFYLRKGNGDFLKKVPNGRKKFKEFIFPIMRDHVEVLREIPDEMFFTGNSIAIVREYNTAAGKSPR